MDCDRNRKEIGCLGLDYGTRTGGPFLFGDSIIIDRREVFQSLLLGSVVGDSMGTKMTAKPFRVRCRNTRLESLDAKQEPQIDIPGSELDLLQRKLELTRLPVNLANEQWGEDNGVTVQNAKELVDFWRTSYDWREQEARLNELPQYTCTVEVENFGDLEMHFVHQTSSVSDAIPLLFVHGWPGSFAEVTKMLPILNEAGFHVVAPSLPGYGFSSCPDKAGFTNEHDAEAVHKVMLKLGYRSYVAQGGDWGSDIVRNLGRMFPEHVKAVHINHINLVNFLDDHKRSTQLSQS